MSEEKPKERKERGHVLKYKFLKEFTDQIVYKLYSLTEKEIAIVERANA